MTRAAAAIWTFVVGDDWITAAGVVLAGSATAALQSAGAVAWWVIPTAVLLLLVRSLIHRGPVRLQEELTAGKDQPLGGCGPADATVD